MRPEAIPGAAADLRSAGTGRAAGARAGRLGRALARHLRDLPGLTGAQAFSGRDGDWTEGGRIGAVPPDAHRAVLGGFDPREGGALAPLPGDRGWQASYMTRGAGLDLVLLAWLAPGAPAELEDRLGRIEARVGWLMVAALSEREDEAEARAAGADLSGPILLDAARARSPRRLADQWIARLERALRPDLAAVVSVRGGTARLRSLSGGGLVERPSDARDGLERLARLAERHRAPLVVGAEDPAQAVPAAADRAQEAALEAARLGAARAMLVPVEEDGRPVAAAVLLWSHEGPAPRAEIADALAATLSEAVAIQRRAHPALLRRAGNWAAGSAVAVFGRTAWKLKLALALAVAALGVAAMTPSGLRPSFPARIEATDRRVVSAPFDGFLARADVEPGDRVEAGALLVAMEDADLRLDLARARARLAGVEAELQAARARRDTAAVRLREAEAAQAMAETRLLERRLDLARVEAERPALVVGGDALRRVGDRVRLGEPLLEVADPDRVRLRALLDEGWVAEMAPGRGALALLAAYPDRPVPARLVHVATDAEDRDGVNSFPAWFELVPPADMRVLDGMRGVVRVEVAETSALAAWTRGLRRWAARAAWRLGLWGAG